tara:strand:+ start:329 stop:700 length:372 start_codon:yes stop_codon:yes gene_type:complete
MSKRKTTNIPEVEISAEILKTIERDYNIGVYENIIDVSAYNNNNVDNANNDDNGNDNYEGVNFNDNSEINDSNVEDVYSQTSPQICIKLLHWVMMSDYRDMERMKKFIYQKGRSLVVLPIPKE